MTFHEYVLQRESTGTVGAAYQGQWPDDNKNGKEFKRIGIRSKIEMSDEPPAKDGMPRKSAEDLYGMSLKKSKP